MNSRHILNFRIMANRVVVPVEQTSPPAAVASPIPDPVKAAKSSTDVSAKLQSQLSKKKEEGGILSMELGGAQIQKIFHLPDKCLPCSSWFTLAEKFGSHDQATGKAKI